MKIKVKIAIMSHLSDAQECMNLDTSNYPGISRADSHINFAKKLILKYPDTNVEVTDDELNELWKEISDISFRSKTELIQQHLSDIINETERATTGNVSHSVVSIKVMATYCLRIINGEI